MAATSVASERIPADLLVGLEYAAEFKPGKDALHWSISLTRRRHTLTCEYTQGVGHLPGYNHSNKSAAYDSEVKAACITGQWPKNGDIDDVRYRHWNGPQLPAPKLDDVLSSLVSDAGALDYPTYEEWAGDMVENPDSREAEKVYRLCLQYGLSLRRMFGDDGLARLREAFQGY